MTMTDRMGSVQSVDFFSARGIWMVWQGVQHGAFGVWIGQLGVFLLQSSRSCGILSLWIAVISSHLTGFNIQGCAPPIPPFFAPWPPLWFLQSSDISNFSRRRDFHGSGS